MQISFGSSKTLFDFSVRLQSLAEVLKLSTRQDYATIETMLTSSCFVLTAALSFADGKRRLVIGHRPIIARLLEEHGRQNAQKKPRASRGTRRRGKGGAPAGGQEVERAVF
jgi:hypothetical protein